MHLCFRNPKLYSKLIVVDIAPKKYSIDFHKNILEVLTNLSLQDYSNRAEIDNVLSVEINDFAIRQFLMKNLYRNEIKEFKWRFNILTLKEKLDNISEIDFSNNQIDIPTLFLKGELSNYIVDDDKQIISSFFSDNQIKSISNSGHWVHAEQTELFYKNVMDFITQE